MRSNQTQSSIVNATTARQHQTRSGEVSKLLGIHANCALDETLFSHRRVKAGQYLVRAGQEFEALYVVSSGFFKSVFTDDCGNEQVISFPMKGDLVGADGIGEHTHVNDVIALSDAQVITIPFNRLDAPGQTHPELQEALFRSMSRQLVDEQYALIAIGAICVESRLARFLIKCGQRMADQGYSARHFNLQMSRQDIGNYLGMKIETVSRSLTALSSKGLIAVKQREVTIVNPDQLEQLARAGSVKADVRVERMKPSTRNCTSKRSTARPVTPWSALTDAQAINALAPVEHAL